MSTSSACPQCRTAIPPGDDRCPACGHAVAPPPAVAPPETAAAGPEPAAAGTAPRAAVQAAPEVTVAGAAPPTGPPPPADTSEIFIDYRPNHRRALIGAAAVGAVILLLLMLYGVRWAVFRPETAVDAYFDALADRDAAAALRAVTRSNSVPGLNLTDSERGLLEAALRSDDYRPPEDVDVKSLRLDEQDDRDPRQPDLVRPAGRPPGGRGRRRRRTA
jgi:hypothetical protein